eukprot:gene25765-16350_t
MVSVVLVNTTLTPALFLCFGGWFRRQCFRENPEAGYCVNREGDQLGFREGPQDGPGVEAR